MDKYDFIQKMPTALDVFRRSLFQWTTLLYVALSSVLVTLAGPFGTFGGLSIWERGAYWTFVIAISFVPAYAVRAVVLTYLDHLSEWPKNFIVAFFFTLLYMPFLYPVTVYVSGGPQNLVLNGWQMAACVAAVALIGSAIRIMVKSEIVAEPEPEPEQVPRLMERLPSHCRLEVHRLSVRDHYVDVFISGSRETLLMRFSDALAELDGIEGLRVHRSHWVARAHVQGVVRDGGRVVIRMKDGASVPVSRSYQSDVEAENFPPLAS